MNMDSRMKKTSREGKIALLFGGAGFEREVSVSGARGFMSEAEKIGLDLLAVFIDARGDFYIFNGKAEDVPNIAKKTSRKMLMPTSPVRLSGKSGFLIDGEIIPVKLVFPLLHGDFGEDGVIQGLLTALGIEFFGADNFTGALAADKIYTKIIAREYGIPTLPEIVIGKNDSARSVIEKIEKSFGFPAFVKPARLGSSIGASVAKSKQELTKSLKKARSVSERIMVEPAIFDKRELECAYYNASERKIITSPAEVALSTGFYDFNLKYKENAPVNLIQRAHIPEGVREKIICYTQTLAEAISARHIARFDYFLLPNGDIYFNEVNTMPGMTPTSLYSAMLRGEGIDFSEFLLNLWRITE